jgi:hypothetical protein
MPSRTRLGAGKAAQQLLGNGQGGGGVLGGVDLVAGENMGLGLVQAFCVAGQ